MDGKNPKGHLRFLQDNDGRWTTWVPSWSWSSVWASWGWEEGALAKLLITSWGGSLGQCWKPFRLCNTSGERDVFFLLLHGLRIHSFVVLDSCQGSAFFSLSFIWHSQLGHQEVGGDCECFAVLSVVSDVSCSDHWVLTSLKVWIHTPLWNTELYEWPPPKNRVNSQGPEKNNQMPWTSTYYITKHYLHTTPYLTQLKERKTWF